MSVARHVIVFPFPEQGHINPALAIADYLLASGIFVTFVHTERSYASLQESRPTNWEQVPNMKVEVVPDIDSRLWSHPAATEQGLDLLLSKLMQCHPSPSSLLVDAFFPWSHKLAARHGLPRVEIWTASAYAFTVGLYVPDLIARGYLPITDSVVEKVVDFIPGLTPFRMGDFPAMLAVSDLKDPKFKFFTSVVEHSKEADRVLAHTVYDVEHAVVDALREHRGIRMDPIGPLVTETRHGLLQEDSTSLSWLDKQEKASVLYIAFGSVYSVGSEALVELAYGLAASEQPFCWVIRPDSNEHASDTKVQEALDLLQKQGKGYITSWAPQLGVLRHPAVGAFLSHCGWNSTFESLHLGVPILGLPLAGEQPINLKCIVKDWKAGLALQEGGKLLSREHVEKTVREMLRGEKVERAREGALRWSRLSHNALMGSSKNNLEKFVDDIKQGQLTVPSHLST